MPVIQKPTLSEQEQQVEDALIAMHVTYQVIYVGEREEKQSDGKGWKHDEWVIQLDRRDGNPNFSKRVASMLQEYRTGLGHRKFPRGYLRLGKPYTVNTVAWHDEQKLKQPVQPPIAGLLYSLTRDAMGAEQVFEDWCGDLGYDSDSIKALETYRACQQTVLDLRKFFTREQREQLEKLLEDY